MISLADGWSGPKLMLICNLSLPLGGQRQNGPGANLGDNSDAPSLRPLFVRGNLL